MGCGVSVFMKSFYRLAAVVCLMTAAVLIGANIGIRAGGAGAEGRMYRVEALRLAGKIRRGGYESLTLESCQYVYRVSRCVQPGGAGCFAGIFGRDGQ